MHVPIVSSVLLLTLFVVHGDPQFRRYMAPYAPSFHDYPFHPHYPSFRDYPEIPQPVTPYHQPRFYFLEKTVVVSSTTNTIYNCRYSTAVLRACRRRRSVEEDAEFIDPSAVASVVPTQEAMIEDVRDKRQMSIHQYVPYDSDYVEPSIGYDQADAGLAPFQNSARFFFQVTTSTLSFTSTITASTLVTCAPLTGFAYPQC